MVNSNQEYYNITAAVDLLGTDTCKALPFLYAFSGCDIVSSFFSKGKCKAWDAWQQSVNKDELTDLFIKLGDKPAGVTSDQMSDGLDRKFCFRTICAV